MENHTWRLLPRQKLSTMRPAICEISTNDKLRIKSHYSKRHHGEIDSTKPSNGKSQISDGVPIT